MLMSFPSGTCVNDVVNIQTNYQFTSVIVMHFMNGTGVRVALYEELLLMCTSVQTIIQDINTTLEKCLEKSRHQK